jgi:hypothetical protein
MFGLRGWEGLGEGVRNHVVSRAVDQTKSAIFNDPSYKVEADVDMFGTGMILVILSECDGGLVVRKKYSGFEQP